MHENTIIGTAGKISQSFLAPILEGEAYGFELDGEFLTTQRIEQKQSKPLVKYQSVALDISMLIPLTVTVASLEICIAQADARIQDLWLLDFYEKPEWGDQRSVTFRFIVQDEHKTMTKEEIDEIMQHVNHAVQSLNVVIR